MKSGNVRESLRRAHAALERVRDEHPSVAAPLAGIAEQLEYAVEGGAVEPEAVVAVERGALDTIQRRLDEVIVESDQEAVAARLQEAREEILLAIVTLEDEWKGQHGSHAGRE